jgi:hypothetical protein
MTSRRAAWVGAAALVGSVTGCGVTEADIIGDAGVDAAATRDGGANDSPGRHDGGHSSRRDGSAGRDAETDAKPDGRRPRDGGHDGHADGSERRDSGHDAREHEDSRVDAREDGRSDGGEHDGGKHDGGKHDGGKHDSGKHDGGEHDSGEHDSGEHDSGEHDSGEHDAGHEDASERDAARDTGHDAPERDAANRDAARDGAVDAPPDAGPVVVVAPNALTFGNVAGMPGFVACGTTPATQTFTVKNDGTTAISWWSAFGRGAGSPYSLAYFTCTVASPCVIQPGATDTVTVMPPAVPANAGVTTFDDTLEVFSSAPGDTGHLIHLSEASYGAILAFSPTDENFGTQPSSGVYTSSPSIQILNSGNATVTAGVATTTGSSAEFTLSTASVDVTTATGGAFDVIFTPAGSTAAVTGAVAITVPANSTCAPLPSNLTLEGQGTAAQVTVTASLDFNTGQNGGVGVSCGTTAAPQNAVVTNSGNGATQITALSLAGGASSPYAIPAATLSALPITVGASSSVNVPVEPNPVAAASPPGALLNDYLLITTTGAALPPVLLEETAAGAVLSLSLPVDAGSSALAFSTTPTASTGTYPVTLTNSGNVAAPVTWSSTASVFTFDAGVVANPAANTNMNAYFMPTSTGASTATGTVVVAAGTPLCGGFGGTIDLSISGGATSGNTYQVAPASVSFGDNPCGPEGSTGTPPAAQSVNLTNTGSATTWTAALTGAGASLFQLSAANGNLPGHVFLGGNGTASFTVVPIPLGSTSGLTALDVEFGVFATLTVTVGTGGTAETFTIPVNESPQGAFAEWDVSGVTVLEGSPAANFALLNVSSYAATFGLSAGDPSFVLSPTSGPASNNAPLISALTDNAGMPATTTISAAFGDAGQVCGPLPAALAVTGE